jgi:hypothetical protein
LRLVGEITDFMTAMKLQYLQICIFSILVTPPYEDLQFLVRDHVEQT